MVSVVKVEEVKDFLWQYVILNLLILDFLQVFQSIEGMRFGYKCLSNWLKLKLLYIFQV